MSYRVTLLAAENDSPYAGLPLQLVRGNEVLASAFTDADGTATFDYTPAAGDALRVRADVDENPKGATS
jgi:uncharacterized protein YfaS (alpha-2-macroglobulin family)